MSLFFGRNTELEKREVFVVGKIEINNKPMRVKVYVALDNLNMLRNALMKLPKEYRKPLLDKCNIVKESINNLAH